MMMNARVMTSTTLLGRVACALLLALTTAAGAGAQGTIGFTTAHTVINSGDAFSSLENGLDWMSPNPPGNIALPSGANVIVASPNALQHIQIESWRETSPTSIRLK